MDAAYAWDNYGMLNPVKMVNMMEKK